MNITTYTYYSLQITLFNSILTIHLENSTPLHWAVVNDKADVVRYLLNCGADPTLLTKRGVNAIHLAAGLGE